MSAGARTIATCHCDVAGVIAYRDPDGDWACCRCGHLVGGSAAKLLDRRAVRGSAAPRLSSAAGQQYAGARRPPLALAA